MVLVRSQKVKGKKSGITLKNHFAFVCVQDYLL